LKAWEAIMSSPIHFDEETDPALMYAPPWARERMSDAVERPTAPVTEVDESDFNGTEADPEFSGDRAILELQRQLALNPDLVPEPSAEGFSVLRPILIRFFGVVGFAAIVAWGIVSYPDLKKTAEFMPGGVSTAAMSSNPASLADVQPAHAAIAAPAAPPVGESRRAASTAAPVVVASTPPQASVTAAPEGSAAEPPAAVASVPAPVSTTSPSPPARADDRPPVQLDAAEIEMLLKRGKDFLASGDIAAARLLLRRAADAGSAEAALTLGTTFDPVMIQRLGAIGTTPDLAKARKWYQRAAELGSGTASQRLAGLDAAH
jgi:hypothetical protein